MGLEAGDVPPKDREDAVLRFIATHGFPMPPAVVFRGMKYKEGIHFSRRTVENILSRLVDEGYMIRVDTTALSEGRIESLGPEDTKAGSYYFLTEAGRERIDTET